MSDIRARLDRLADEADARKRRLVAVGILTEALAPHGIEPILVGGGALEFYTPGATPRVTWAWRCPRPQK